MAASPAMERLQNMVAASAIHDGERDEKDDYTRMCHPGTREEHLEYLKMWANNKPTEKGIEWVNATAGAGKTAMLRTFCADREEETGFPSISFFAWKGDARRNTLKHFPATVTYQLSRRINPLVPYIEKAINEDPLLLQSAFKKQMDKLVIRPLLDCFDAIEKGHHLIIVIDGLDELDSSGQAEFLDFIPYLLRRLSSLPISLLVSSRPDVTIAGAFQHPKLASITRATRLGASDEDIWKFLNDKFDDINLRYPFLEQECGGKWPSHEKREIMVRQSSGLFIWPTVAITYIDKVEKGLGHNARLKHVLSSAEPKPWIASPLDNLYRAILEAHAPEDRDSAEFFQFKLRLALFCLPVYLRIFVVQPIAQVVDWSDAPVRVVFGETLDDLWSSMAGLSSLFSPRAALSEGGSVTPSISHLSLRDFMFNRARCGDELYYTSEQALHTKIVCKLIDFFNTRQAYQNFAEMSGAFINCAGNFLEAHLKEAAVSEELGRRMDDVVLEVIPTTWPLVTQVYLIVTLFDGLYNLTGNLDFPDGTTRREALLTKISMFFKSRAANAQQWDIALFRLALSTANFEYSASSFHSAHCWHVSRATQCACIDAYLRNIPLVDYQRLLGDSALFQHATSRLVANRRDDVGQDCLDVLHFFLSLSKTGQSTTELSHFIQVNIDYWILVLLEHCPPNSSLYDIAGSVCIAPLPDLPERDEEPSDELVQQFLKQTEAFNKYTKRCLKAGIETKFPPIMIPDDWWQDRKTQKELLRFGYQPPFEIPNDWWHDELTRSELLCKYQPPFEIPDDWWEDWWAPGILLDQGFKPPFNIPDEWWWDRDIRRVLRRRGYQPPDSYSAEETAASSTGDLSDEDGEAAVHDAGADQRASRDDEPLAGGEAFSGGALAQVPPPPPDIATSPNPLHVQPVALAHPATTSAVGVENAGRQRHGFRNALKNLFRR